MKCNKRKQIIKKKRTKEIGRQNMTYANITQATLSPKMLSFSMPQFTREEMLKINICVAHANYKNQERPGSYASELSKILRANNLPNIIIPEDTDLYTQQMNLQPDVGATSQATAQLKPKPSVRKLSNQGALNTSHDSLSIMNIDAKDLGLEFYTSKDNGRPENFSTEELVKGIFSNKYKFTNKRFTEEQVLKKTQRGEINISDSFFALEIDEYRKIRSGLVQERSPIENRDPRLRKASYN